MFRPINIHKKGQEIDISEGRYRIYLLGGFGVKTGGFKVLFMEKGTDEILESRRAIFPVQTYAFGKRAKRILIVDITKSSTYILIFQRLDEVEIKHSNLFLMPGFLNRIQRGEMKIVITKSLGILPING